MACAIIVGTNSWITLPEAEAYMECLPEADVWDSKTPNQKCRAIITAFRMIYNSQNFNIPLTSTDQIVKDAQSELSNYIIEFYTSHKKRMALYAQGVRDFKISKWEEELNKGGIPEYIKDMLSDFYIGGEFRFFQIERDMEANV